MTVCRASAAEPLLGRADELGRLGQVLDDLDAGRSGTIELVGEPGIGKTRLLRELAARAEPLGHLVLSTARLGGECKTNRRLSLPSAAAGIEHLWSGAIRQQLPLEAHRKWGSPGCRRPTRPASNGLPHTFSLLPNKTTTHPAWIPHEAAGDPRFSPAIPAR